MRSFWKFRHACRVFLDSRLRISEGVWYVTWTLDMGWLGCLLFRRTLRYVVPTDLQQLHALQLRTSCVRLF